MHIRRFLAAATLAALAPAVPAAHAASQDGNVEWNGISHVSWQDRRPVCPIGGEAFQVRFRAYHDDLTSARVHSDDGTPAWTDAAVIEQRGPYDIWMALVPATGAAQESYYIELNDGADTDYYSVSGMSEDTPVDGGFVIDFTTLSHAPLGATLVNGSGTVFKVWAPGATTAHVRGDFNGWNLVTPMTKVGDTFIAHVTPTLNLQRYKYFFNNDNNLWKPDPRGRAQDAPNNDNSYIVNPFLYDWAVPDFHTPPLEQMVIYQLHVGTFSGRNDPLGTPAFPGGYADVAARVSHLAELGVNAVMVNPVTEFPGDESAGYNPQTQWAPEWAYGSPEELRAMVDSLHAHGIAVLLDIVWNHFTVNSNYLWNFDGTQVYFDTPQVDTPWGAQADFDEPEVRDYFAHSAHLWLEEYRVDGFRMDATDYMDNGAHLVSGWSLMQRLNDEMDNRWADKVTIAEELPDDPNVTKPTALGGAGFDAQYHDAFTDRLREEIQDAAFGDPEMWKIAAIINGSGTYLNGRNVVNYVELHDEAWPSSGGQRLVKTIDPTFPHDDEYARGRTMLAQGVTLFAPGVPAMLMGTEWLEDTDFGTGAANRIDWSKKTTYAGVFQYYRDAIALRTAEPALFANAGHSVHHFNEGGNVIGWRRWDNEGNHFVILANFSNSDYVNYRIGVPVAGDWEEAINSRAPAYGGTGATNPGTIASDAIAQDGFGQSVAISLPRMALIVLRPSTGTVDVTPADIGGALALAPVVPTPARGPATLRFTMPAAGPAKLTVLDPRGRRIATLINGTLEAGTHVVRWSGTDVRGTPAPPGVYFVRLEAAGTSIARRFPLVR